MITQNNRESYDVRLPERFIISITLTHVVSQSIDDQITSVSR